MDQLPAVEDRVRAHLDKIEEIHGEILFEESKLALSDEIASLHDQPGWKMLVDRLRTLDRKSMATLRSRTELSPHSQGWHQGRLDLLDYLLKIGRMTPQDIDDTQRRITMLRERLHNYQQVIR